MTFQVLHPDGRVAVDPYRFQIEAADPLEVNVGVGGPSQIDLGATGSYGFAVQSLVNVDTPYTIIEYAFPNIQNRHEGLIPGPAIEFASGLRGDGATIAPLFDSVSTFDFSSVVPELNLDGVLTARGVAIDLPAGKTTEIGSAVTIYPELRTLLETNPDFLKDLGPFALDDLAFDFYVVAAATPLTSAQYVEYQTDEAARLRDAILNDVDASPSLRSIAGDSDAFADLYMDALVDLGLLRPEDAAPLADGRAETINAFFIAVGGLIGGDAGSGIIDEAAVNLATAETTLGDLVEKLRGYYGHTEDVTSGGGVPLFDEYDLGLDNPTSFVTFELRAGPAPLFEGGEVIEDIVFDTDTIGELVGDRVSVTGPSGFRDENFVPISTPLPYTVNATYDSDATGAAREIRVIVPLDDTLDERSVQVADIQLGGRAISLPPGRPNFVGEFDFFDDDGYVLQVTAGIDANTRVVSYLLRAIDPRDGLPPVDSAVGLLQPGESLKVGFWANADTTAAVGTGGELATGDALNLTARVIVDGGEATDSETTFATLDAFAPTSTVSATPLGGDRFEITWSATDDVGGSGVSSYSLLVSNDGGNRYRSVLYRTSETAFTYQAKTGQSPVFLVRAIDAAGNVESVPDGIRVPRLVPEINLGAAPQVSIVAEVVLPRAEPDTSNTERRLFTEAAFGIPSRTSATQPSQFARVIRPLAAERFTTIRGDSGASIGTLAMTVSPDGQTVYISGGAGRNELYAINLQTRESTTLAAGSTPIYELTFDSAGQLWASTGGEGLLQLDPTTGAVLDSFGAGVSLGIASLPGETTLYVATTGGVQKFDTATRAFSPFSNIRVDSLAVANDGTLYGTAWPDGDEILRFDFRGRAEVVATVDGGAESIAFGPSDSVLDGLLIVGHAGSGQVSVLDPVSLQQTTIASSGFGRVEGIEPLPGGRFLVTQGDQVDVFFSVAAPRVIETEILRGNNRANLLFDVALDAADPSDSVSGSNLDNYTLTNLETGEETSIGAVRYDAPSRTAELLFEQLPPAEYELSVSAAVQSEQGIPIGGDGFATTFRVFEDLTVSMSVAYQNTRVNRADGTLLFDVIVTNNSGSDVAGPINIVFDNLGDDSVVFFGNDGLPADAQGFQLFADGLILSDGTSSAPQTITIENSQLIDLNFDPRILASLPPNQLPNFNSTPLITAGVSAEYEYTAQAEDPDGSSITYVLAGGPSGATVDPATGKVDWMPDRSSDARVDFELRAYDGRGAYRRQVWTVDVTDANRAPIISPVDDQLFTEGDLIEIPVSAFDPDGDDLFYFADSLPPGAVFDSVGQALRWRPGGDDAGEYENVTLIVSDGFVETSVSFDIVIANNNVPPVLSPIPDRTINEGDGLTLNLFATDEDGDTLRYLSPNLPPGAFLDPNTGLFEWTPGFDQHGVFDLRFFADDGVTLAEQTMVLTVNNLNGQVTFPQLGEFEIFEGQTVQLRIAAFDPEFPVAPNSPQAVSEDFFIDFEGLIAELIYSHDTLPAGADYDMDRQIFSWTPDFDASGLYQLNFTATDDGDDTGTPTTDTVTLTINVRDANGAPEVTNVDAQTVAIGDTLNIPIVAVDPEGAPIELSVQIGQSTELPSWASLSDNGDGTGTLTVSPTPGDRDDYLVTVTARETTGEGKLSGQGQFILQATSDNEPPILQSVFDAVLVPDAAYSLSLFVTDADQDPLTFTATSLPAGAALTPSSIYGEATLDWTPTTADIGDHTITFTVTDSGNDGAAAALSTSHTVMLTVRETNGRPNLAPIGQQTVAEGQLLTLQASATDSDGDTIHYTAGLVEGTATGQLPRGAVFDPSSGELRWTPDSTQAGTYRIRITASDGAGSRSDDVLVTVTNTNQDPSFSTLPRLFAREGDQLIFSITAGDPDGETLVYAYTGTPLDGFQFDPTTRTVVWDVNFDSAGSYVLPFSVTDPASGTDTLQVDVQVLPTNRAPELVAPTLRNAEIGELLEIPLEVSDPDGDTVTVGCLRPASRCNAGRRQRVAMDCGRIPSRTAHRSFDGRRRLAANLKNLDAGRHL